MITHPFATPGQLAAALCGNQAVMDDTGLAGRTFMDSGQVNRWRGVLPTLGIHSSSLDDQEIQDLRRALQPIADRFIEIREGAPR